MSTEKKLEYPHDIYIRENQIDLKQASKEIKDAIKGFNLLRGRADKCEDATKKESLYQHNLGQSAKIKQLLEAWMKEHDDFDDEDEPGEPAGAPVPAPPIEPPAPPSPEPPKAPASEPPAGPPVEPPKPADPLAAEPPKPAAKKTKKEKKIEILEALHAEGIKEISKDELRKRGYPCSIFDELSSTGETVGEYQLKKSTFATKYNLIKK